RGIGMLEIARRALELHAGNVGGEPASGGFYKHRRGEDAHITAPMVVLDLQKSVRSGDRDLWDKYLSTIDDRDPAVVRDLLTFVGTEPVDEVESADQIMRRFTTAAMSL